jgi:hypothetical protein
MEVMNIADLNDMEWLTIRTFCESCTIPIIAENNTQSGVHGTGTLFEMNNRLYVITAGHVVESIMKYPNNYGIPIAKLKSDVYTFNKCDCISPSSGRDIELYDIAMMHIQDDQMCRLLKSNYSFLTKHNLSKVHNVSSDYLIVGFPAGMSTCIPGKQLYGNSLMLVTKLRAGKVSDIGDPNPHFDLFFHYPEFLVSDKGVQVPAPDLRGISGSSIWLFTDYASNSGLWYPGDLIKVVGIERSYKRKDWVRGIKWNAVAHLFDKTDKDAKEELLDVLS